MPLAWLSGIWPSLPESCRRQSYALSQLGAFRVNSHSLWKAVHQQSESPTPIPDVDACFYLYSEYLWRAEFPEIWEPGFSDIIKFLNEKKIRAQFPEMNLQHCQCSLVLGSLISQRL